MIEACLGFSVLRPELRCVALRRHGLEEAA